VRSVERVQRLPVSTSRPDRRNHGLYLRRVLLRLRILLGRSRLDRELATGADLGHPARRERGRQLATLEARERVAANVERLIAEAHRRDPILSAAVPVRHDAIREARPELIGLARSLREPVEVSPQGIARTLILLTDGAGPVFNSKCGASLRGEVQAAEAALYLGPKLDA
jgi:hypothetical protein